MMNFFLRRKLFSLSVVIPINSELLKNNLGNGKTPNKHIEFSSNWMAVLVMVTEERC